MKVHNKYTSYIITQSKRTRAKNRQKHCIVTPKDPWGLKQQYWNTGANEDYQLNAKKNEGRDQIKSSPNQLKQGIANDTILSHCTILLTGLIAGWIC